MHPDDDLRATLQTSQELGFLGARPPDEVIAHARGFVAALSDVTHRSDGGPTIIDLGSGGGVPGLVIAHDLPDARVTLLDRRAKRTDFLERAVRRLGWSHRVDVRCADAERVSIEQAATYDAVVARSFGPPEHTLRLATALARDGGRIVISEPPDGDRWDPGVLDELGVERIERIGIGPRLAVFHVHR